MNQIVEKQPEIIEPSIQWVEINVRLNDLKPFEQNPRTISESMFNRLKDSLIQDGYRTRIEATQDLRVISGHQRLKALQECAVQLGLDLEKVPILIPDREIPDDQFKRIMVRSNVNNGQWDWDMASSMFEAKDMADLGVREANQYIFGDQKPGKRQVCCPQCKHVFDVKGNAAIT